MYGCESWTVKKAERRRIDAFELWRRLLRVPWTARRSNQSIRKEISPGISLEGIMLKLKLQYFGHLMRRVDSLEDSDAGRDLGAGGEGDDRGWDGWMASLTRWTWVCVNSGRWWWIGRPGVLQFMGSQRVGHDWATELNWTELQLLTLNIHWKEFRVEIRNEALCALGKTSRTGLQFVRYFQVKFFMSPNSCIFSYLEKHQHHRPMSGPGYPA